MSQINPQLLCILRDAYTTPVEFVRTLDITTATNFRLACRLSDQAIRDAYRHKYLSTRTLPLTRTEFKLLDLVINKHSFYRGCLRTIRLRPVINYQIDSHIQNIFQTQHRESQGSLTIRNSSPTTQQHISHTLKRLEDIFMYLAGCDAAKDLAVILNKLGHDISFIIEPMNTELFQMGQNEWLSSPSLIPHVFNMIFDASRGKRILGLQQVKCGVRHQTKLHQHVLTPWISADTQPFQYRGSPVHLLDWS
jgi:hypothetical protein